MQGIARQYGVMIYLLTVIDVFSKFALAVPDYFKNVNAIMATFGQVLKTANPRLPKRLQTDKVKKIFNSTVQSLL